MNTGIYQIQNRVTGCRYIGSAKSIGSRWALHRRSLDRKAHHSKYMERSWHSHGAASFEFSALIYCSQENLLMYEQRFLDAYRPEYNSNPTAGSMLGFKFTQESKDKMAEAARRTKNFTGRTHSDESKLKISQGRKGKGGGYRSPERCARISSALTGLVVPADVRAKISATLTGHKQTPEQIEKRAAKLRGRKMPTGFAESASRRMMGRRPSMETVEKMSRSKCKLTEETVREIRVLRGIGLSHRAIALATNTGRATVADICSGRGYAWVSP